MKSVQLEELRAIAGPDGVSQVTSDLDGYFREPPGGASLTLVKPENQHDLALAAGFAYENDIPMYTHRRGFLGPEVAGSDGILFDLTGIDEVVRIDEPNLLAFVQYGVTFESLKEQLDELGLRILMPAAATSSSIVRSYVDRDVILANGATRPYQLTIFHAILADGRLWMSGNDQMTPDGHSEFREDIGPMYSYFFHASEDIYGMPYAAKVFLYRRWEERRVTAYGFESAEDAIRAAYLASRGDQVFECVAADARYLGVLLTENVEEADALAAQLPPWTVVFGFDNAPELVEVWDRQTAKIAEDLGIGRVSGDLAGMMEERFELPWYLRQREFYRGAVGTVDWFAFSGKAPGMLELSASKAGDRPLGQVAIPSYYGGAFYCETDIYHEPDDPGAQDSLLEAYDAVLDDGAHVNRPSGKVAEKVYGRMNRENLNMIKNLKNVLDPKGLLNRGQLIEGV